MLKFQFSLHRHLHLSSRSLLYIFYVSFSVCLNKSSNEHSRKMSFVFQKLSSSCIVCLWKRLCSTSRTDLTSFLRDFEKQPQEVFYDKRLFRNFTKFTGKHLCQSSFFNKVAGLKPATLLKKRLAQVFSCEFCEISKGTFFTEHLLTTASGFLVNLEKIKHGKVGFITEIILNKKYKRSD